MLYTDQLKRKVRLSNPPKRIISLVPSQTELLIDLGLEDRVIGITKFCVHPEGLIKRKAIVGGTKNYRMDMIHSLQPDLIIGNKEENDQKAIENLMKEYPVWMSDVNTVTDGIAMIRSIGEMLEVGEQAEKIAVQLETDFQTPLERKGTCVYLIWKDPLMVVGKNTFIDQILTFGGFENRISENRYPKVSLDELVEIHPDYLLLSSEPFPFKEKHIEYFESHLSETKICLVDGEYFSWYGSRMLGTKQYLSNSFS
ncbi:ABC transporter substrate-binding protein [Algoriphagus lutimaris]|nr:helical backbone metal receptor [Algoriphagus lutimaris]MBN3520489.1 ABC transporter substrate-binding protein [Algoriphagus lutimaris]